MSSPSKKTGVLCTASTSFKKRPGTLTLTKTTLKWAPTSSTSSDSGLSVSTAFLASLFTSKEGGAKVILRVCVSQPGAEDENHNFTFMNAGSAVSDREKFKHEISQIIAKNRAATSTAPTPVTAAATPIPAVAATPTDPTQDLNIRKRVLLKNPELRQLHSELVRSGQILEAEFWEGREYLLLAEAQSESQIAGRSAKLVDPRPESGDAGEVKIKLSPALIQEIFGLHEVVRRAYNDNVPKPLSETEFWHRYFHSKLFDRHRAMTGHGSMNRAGQGLKDDDIFDKYLEEPDDDLEPKHLTTEEINSLLDLAATEQDHAETGNTRDYTMRAGMQKKSLPLMRFFNEHSVKLVNASLGEREATTVIDGGNAGARKYYDDIVIDDLQAADSDDRIHLDVGDAQRFFDTGEDGATNGKRKRSDQEIQEIYEESAKKFAYWDPQLSTYNPTSSSIASAMGDVFNSLTASASQSITHKSLSTYFPSNTQKSVLSTQTTSNEFLRHFWNAVLPSDAPAAEKAKKALKMIGYLEKTKDRIDGVVEEAVKEGVQREKVEWALRNTELAVKRALDYFRQRMK